MFWGTTEKMGNMECLSLFTEKNSSCSCHLWLCSGTSVSEGGSTKMKKAHQGLWPYCHLNLNIGSWAVCSKAIAELFFAQFLGIIAMTDNRGKCQSRLCEVLDQYSKSAHGMTALKVMCLWVWLIHALRAFQEKLGDSFCLKWKENSIDTTLCITLYGKCYKWGLQKVFKCFMVFVVLKSSI